MPEFLFRLSYFNLILETAGKVNFAQESHCQQIPQDWFSIGRDPTKIGIHRVMAGEQVQSF